MRKKIVLILAVVITVLSIASCGVPDGGVYGKGDPNSPTTYAGKTTESISVNQTWYPLMTAGQAFEDSGCYIVITDGNKKVTLNDDGSITGNESGQVKVEIYKNGNLEKKVTLMVLGY